MTVNQIYELINSVNTQMWGDSAIAVHDLSGIISLGDAVFSSANDRDVYLETLIDRIGKTVFRNLDLDVEFPNFIRNEFEWGAILCKVNIQPNSAVESKAWEIGDNNFTPNNFEVSKPVVFQRLFKGVNAWEYHISISDIAFKSAFQGASQYGAFVEGIMGAMSNDLTMAINNMNHMSLCNFIAEKIKAGNGVVHCLTDFNERFHTEYTINDVEGNKDIYRYVGMLIRNYIKYLGQPSKLYNVGIDNNKMLRATKRDDMHVLISADFASGMSTYLYSDDFNYEFDKLPLYDEYVSLQGTGNESANFIDNTSINIKPSSGGNAITASGVVAVLADRQAIGTFYEDIFTATDRNNRNRYTGYTQGCTLGFFNDLSENGIIFVMD